jgi:L-galactonate dehydratase
MVKITDFITRDVRFPVCIPPEVIFCYVSEMYPNHLQTSLDKTGSDAMNAAGDYSAAYCIIYTDSQYSGHGMVWITLYKFASGL